jgi:hypothetical protein
VEAETTFAPKKKRMLPLRPPDLIVMRTFLPYTLRAKSDHCNVMGSV